MNDLAEQMLWLLYSVCVCVCGNTFWWRLEYTVRLVLIAWFNNCVLVKLGKIANPIIAIVDPIPYRSIPHVYVCDSINCKRR